MPALSPSVGTILYAFGKYLFIMAVFLGVSVVFHELGHILFVKYHGLDYKIVFRKGNLTVSADWDRLGDKKVYGHIMGILFGLPPIIVGMWMYSTPIFLLLYLIACYDDFSAVALRLLDSKRVFLLS
jgi:hypothetical protein